MNSYKNITALLVICSFLCTAFILPGPDKEYKVEISTRYGKAVVRLFNETPLHRDNFVKLVKEGFYDSLLFHRVIPGFMIQGGDPGSKHALSDQPLGSGETGYKIPAEINPRLYHKRGALAAARDNNPEKASSGCQFYIVQGHVYKAEELNEIQNKINYNMKYSFFQQVIQSDSVKIKLDDFKLRGDDEGLRAYISSLQPVVDKQYQYTQLNFTTQQLRDYITIGGAPHLDGNYTVFGEVISGMNVIDSIAAQKTGAMDRPLEDLRMKMKLIP